MDEKELILKEPGKPIHGHRFTKYQEGLHFVTLNISHKIPVFKIFTIAKIASKTLFFYESIGDYILKAFVIMPDHIHAIFDIMSDRTISEIIRDIKKYIARYIIKKVDTKKLSNFLLPEEGKRKYKYHIWQEDFYDYNLLHEDKMLEKMEYIVNNPLKAELCDSPEDYPWLYLEGNYMKVKDIIE